MVADTILFRLQFLNKHTPFPPLYVVRDPERKS